MKNWTEGYIDTNGMTMHYTRTGGDKPQVVLCHGFSDSGECWMNLAKHLDADYDVLMVDARCHGLSSAPESGNNADAMAADLAGFMAALNLDKPVVAGHSMGARYTHIFAARYPELLRGLVLEDPPWRAPVDESVRRNRPDRGAMFIKIRGQSLAEGVAECEAEHPDWEAGTCETTFRAHQQLRYEQHVISAPDTMTWQEAMPKLQCPVLMFTGDPELGGIVTGDIYAEAKALFPALQRVHISGVGHHIRFAAPEPFTAAFKAFLAQVYA